MKKPNGLLKIIIAFVAGMAVMYSAFFARDLIQFYRVMTRKPILKVISIVQGGFLPSKNNYYIVYDNGDYKEVDEFEPTEVETYDLLAYKENTESDKNKSENIPECANEILKYAEKFDYCHVNNLYVDDGRYFFDIHNTKVQKKYSSTVYEYFPDSNSVKKLVRFEHFDTEHVELY